MNNRHDMLLNNGFGVTNVSVFPAASAPATKGPITNCLDTLETQLGIADVLLTEIRYQLGAVMPPASGGGAVQSAPPMPPPVTNRLDTIVYRVLTLVNELRAVNETI